MYQPIRYRKALSTSTGNAARDYAHNMANAVAAFVEAAYASNKDHPFIASRDFTQMLECIDEAITEGFWEAIKEEDKANEEASRMIRSDYEEHNTNYRASRGC